MELLLEVGKVYLRRDGQKTGPLILADDFLAWEDLFPFIDPETSLTYMQNGSVVSPSQEYPEDIVEVFFKSSTELPVFEVNVEPNVWS